MAGIAVVRVSGPGSFDAAERLSGPLPRARMAALRKFRSGKGGLIDEGLLIVFAAPQSFTGEDSCEFHIHGGLAVQSAVLRELAAIPGLRAAEPGEFTRRAMRNGKLDLMEVEGLSDLIRAQTDRQRRQALHHAGGEASGAAEKWRADLIGIWARVAAAIDFADEPGVAEEALREVREPLAGLIAALETALGEARRGEAVREGIRIVLAGPPNAGKSSILNYLARRDAAIVSPLPGTTRDTIEVMIELSGVPVILTDTAGLREMPDDEIEAAGMERTYRAGRAADMVVWITGRGDPLSDPPPEFDSETVWIENKIDLPERGAPGMSYRVSAKTGEGMTVFIDGLESRVRTIAGSMEPPVLVRARHEKVIRDCFDALKTALDSQPQQIELMAEELRRAGEALARLTGRVDVEDLLDAIFREFCIGK